MSFDIFFQPCRYGGKTLQIENPFTGKVQSSLATEPLSAAELKAVKNVLKHANADRADENGCFVVEFNDGGSAEVSSDDLRNGCAVALQGLTADLSRFLFDFLKAGNWVMVPAMQDAVAITASPESIKGKPKDFPRVVVCNSAEELTMLLSKSVGAWQKYQDQIQSGKHGR